jgi:arylsulfatase A-like enzyme
MKTRISWLFVATFIVTALACGTEEQTASEDRPPNIVFIMADDLGYGDVGAYGQEHIRTPRIDQMAEEGTKFTQFYSGSTVCAPTRSVLMTGQHTGHTHIRGNKEIQPIGQEPLPAGTYTVAHLLQDAGYRTGMFGKWGLGPPESTGEPQKQGFDYYYGYLGQRRAHFYYPEFLFRNGKRVPLEGNVVEENPPVPGAGQPVERGTYSHDAIAEEALAFIDRNQDRPFFMYVPFTIPHAELLVPEDAMEPYLDEDGNSIFPEDPYPGAHYSAQPMPHATYAAMVSRMDRDVGRILDRLRERGLAENTIVFFTSDNGPHDAGGYDPTYLDGNGPFRGIKRDLYEGGIRVPMIAWGPGTVPSGRTSEAVWAQWDFLPTAADIAGVNEVSTRTDGMSFWPEIQGQSDQQPEHDYLYWEYYARGSSQAVRMGHWKGVRQPMFDGEMELYDLRMDAGETNNIAAGHPDIVEQLEKIMEEAHEPSGVWSVDN